MKIGKLRTGLPLLLCGALLFCSAPAWSSAETGAKPAATATAGNEVKGKVMGVSRKAKAITIETAKGPVMVKFDDATTGMEHAKEGEAAIVSFRVEGKSKIAVSVEPKLAALPAGTQEMQPRELVALLGSKKDNYLLIDSRPAARYAEAHIPGAVSIPVEKMGEMAKTVLPMDRKDMLLVFYCGGVT